MHMFWGIKLLPSSSMYRCIGNFENYIFPLSQEFKFAILLYTCKTSGINSVKHFHCMFHTHYQISLNQLKQ